MSVENLNKVPEVDIDPQGVFKYILMKVYGNEVAGKEPCKMIVRGYKICPFHADIFDKVCGDLDPLGLDAECVGGGRINHDPDAKTIKVYGYSQGYGKADHEVSVGILKKVFVDYEITCSDEANTADELLFLLSLDLQDIENCFANTSRHSSLRTSTLPSMDQRGMRRPNDIFLSAFFSFSINHKKISSVGCFIVETTRLHQLFLLLLLLNLRVYPCWTPSSELLLFHRDLLLPTYSLRQLQSHRAIVTIQTGNIAQRGMEDLYSIGRKTIFSSTLQLPKNSCFVSKVIEIQYLMEQKRRGIFLPN